MAAAKRARQPLQVYEESLERRTSGRLAMTQDLKTALDRQQFQLYYQPKIELATGTMVAVEALARWPHPERGQVPVDMFISALQQTGLISPFTDWVIATALAQRQQWLQRGWDIRIAVNMPITVMLERDFIDRLGRLVAQSGMADGLLFEITENIFLSDYDRLIELLDDLQRFGVRFSIDDFGTGHSSLSRLRQLPVDQIKIDRSFVMDMLSNNDDEVIVKSIIELAHNLGIEVCAEGVESAEVMQQLYRWRCDLVQGYHVSKARAVDKLESFITSSPWAIQRTGGRAAGKVRPDND
jgi:EAL domain-containing protein (putative c-di-GMP-specific phosphodiesterase class I)